MDPARARPATTKPRCNRLRSRTNRRCGPAHALGAAAVLAAVMALPSASRAQADLGRSLEDVNIVVPQRRTIAPITGRFGPVELREVQARIAIRDQVASTTLRFAVFNPGQRVTEAQLLLPVPEGSAVKHFELEGLGEHGIARVLPRDEATRIYQEIVSKNIDPGLLEFVGCNLIKSSVFPVPASGTQWVNVQFEQVLPADGARVDYVLPRTEALEITGTQWSIAVEIASTTPVSTVYSPSHDLVTSRESDRFLKINVPSASATNDAGPFRISYVTNPGNAVALTTTMFAYPDPQVGGGKGGYFLAILGLPRAGDRPAVKREVTLVIDRSGSMRGEKMEQAREASRQIIEALADGEAFNIIDYSTDVAMFNARPVIKNPQTIVDARRYLAALTPVGGTNIHDALAEALRQPATEGMLPMVLFLTDGLPTVGVRGEQDIIDSAKGGNPHQRRIFTFGVGTDVNAPLLTAIARDSRSTATFVLPDEDVEVKVGAVFARLQGPVLASPKLEAINANGSIDTRRVRDMLPATLADVFDGEQVIVLGQYTDDAQFQLRLSGEFFGVQKQMTLAFDPATATTRHNFVPRLWAGRKIAQLVDEIRRMGASPAPHVRPTEDPRFKELVDEIVRLSTRWGVLTEYTAFLATEPSAMPQLRAGIDDLANLGLVGGGRGDRESGRAFDIANAPAAAGSALQRRALDERAGFEGINQELNVKQLAEQTRLNARNEFLQRDMQRVQIQSVRQVADRAMYQRNVAGKDRWVDAGLLDKEAADPEQIIERGSEAFMTLAARLAKENRQGLLSLTGDVYLMLDGKRTLIRTN